MDEVVIDQLVVHAIHPVGVSELKTEPKCVIDKSASEMSSSTQMLAAEN